MTHFFDFMFHFKNTKVEVIEGDEDEKFKILHARDQRALRGTSSGGRKSRSKGGKKKTQKEKKEDKVSPKEEKKKKVQEQKDNKKRKDQESSEVTKDKEKIQKLLVKLKAANVSFVSLHFY